MTYREAHDVIIAELQQRGWTLTGPNLKTRHITSPTAKTRLWFKEQSIYFTFGPPNQSHMLSEARSTHSEDCRGEVHQNAGGFVDRLLATLVRWNSTTIL